MENVNLPTKLRFISPSQLVLWICLVLCTPAVGTEIFADRFAKLVPPEPGSVFDFSTRQLWLGDVLEGATEYCENRHIRWISVVTDFDVNLDGKSDILLPITCYLGPDPAPGEKHNRQVVAAWRMFCSQDNDQFVDCTEDLFGTQAIRATGESKTGGGNPYIHVMDTPRDINNDGYPDFWYALNRDDGRPGFNYSDPDDFALLEEFCGPYDPDDPTWGCTRTATQTVLLSQGDGTYAVVEMPFGQTNTQATAMLPNTEGTVDFFAFNYGPYAAARLTKDNTFVDVTDEYATYKNIRSAALINPYVATFTHEGEFYLVSSEVPSTLYENPTADDFDALSGSGPVKQGMALWTFEAGVGFTLSDFYTPNPEDAFTYKVGTPDNYTTQPGSWIRGIPVYSPRWNFFEFGQLHPNEEPILIAVQESFGTTAGEFFKAPPDPDLIYEAGKFRDTDAENHIYGLSAVEGFYIRDGKFVAREKPVVAGEVAYNMPGFKVIDLNKDGYNDLYGISGGTQRPSIYINDKTGTLRKIDLNGYIPEFEFNDPQYGWVYGGNFTIRDLGRAPYLDFIYWGTGDTFRQSWYADDYVIKAQEFGIIQSTLPIDRLPILTPEEEQQLFTDCLGATWRCNFFFPTPDF